MRQLVSGSRDPVFFAPAGGDPFLVARHNIELLAWLVLRMRAPVKSAMPVGALPRALGVYRRLASDPQYRLTVLGYAAATAAWEDGEILNVAVDLPARGRGVGGELLDEAIAMAVQRNLNPPGRHWRHGPDAAQHDFQVPLDGLAVGRGDLVVRL